MIIYIFNNYFYNKIVLPKKINGVYSLYINNNLFLGNVEEKDGKWALSLGENIFFVGEAVSEIKENINFTVENRVLSSTYNIFVTPSFVNYNRYSIIKDTLTIGNVDADIVYNNNIEYKLSFKNENNNWVVETNNENLFINDDRVVSKSNIHNGDYFFFYGLKFYFINKMIFLNSNDLILFINNGLNLIKNDDSEKFNVVPANIAEDTPLFSKDDYFFKSPRFNSILEEVTVKIDEPPAPLEDNDLPAILTVGPQLTMLSTSIVSLVSYISTYMKGQGTKSSLIFSMTTMVITIVGAILWPNLTRYFNKKRLKKREQKRQTKYKDYLDKKQHEISLIKTKQRQIIMQNTTSLENCKIIIDTKPRNLWERNIEHEDFLQVRLGIGNVDTKIVVDIPEEKFSLSDEDNLFEYLKNVVKDSLTIKGAPLSLSLVKNNITAIVGDEKLAKDFVDGLFLQIMTFHAYTELKIIVYTEDKNKWDYLKVLPHCWNNQKSIRYFATNSDELNTITTELEKVFDKRSSDDSSDENKEDNSNDKNENYKNYKPYYLFFTDDINTIRNNTLIKKILKNKINNGFSLLMLNDRLSTLPSETASFINIDDQISGLVTNEVSENNQKQFTAEYLNGINIYECAQKVANIPINVEKAKYELPNSLSFLEMYGVGRVEQLNVNERWVNNNPVNSLSVPIGIDQNGELFKMDIHEKFYGPHGLVAGTTGSGKSEWIITYILSLAVNFSPDEVQFVLIDYKGGGLALSFENKELGIKLPHLAGTITNLDKSAINRSIASMESELKRRQSVFNETREKLKEGSMNIYKYQQFYRKGLVKEPMSHLLIICDEFAELKQQQPEFMDQLISISRIGRSLGVHLILATQKPTGVVNDQIWSNSKFKVCLKVQDKGDSNEILKKPDAAFLKQAGAFYLEVGSDDYYNLGQSAWAGAKYFPSDFLMKKIDQSVQYIDNIGRTINEFGGQKVVKTENKGEELLNIVQYIDSITKKEKYNTRQLWLENVKPISYLADLNKKYNHVFTKFNFDIPIGEYDEPRSQKQGLMKIDLKTGNIAIIGQTGSGKENLISTIMWSSMLEHTPQEIIYYVIDFGSETLKKYAKFPHVGEVLLQDNSEKIPELLQLIIDELDNRKDLFSEYNGSYDYYIKNSGKTLPLINFVINGFDVLVETFTKLDELFNTLFRDCSKYGIIFTLSVSSTSALKVRQLQYFNNVIMLQIPDDSYYRSITNCRRDLIPSKVFGRGIAKTGVDEDSYCEFQTALIAPDDVAYQYIKDTANKLVQYYKGYKAPQLAKIPDNVTSDDLSKFITDLTSVPIGYNFYGKDIAKYNFLDERINLVTSKNLKGSVSFLYGLAAVLSKIPNTKVRVVDMLGIFNKPMLDIKFFNDDLDTVIGALSLDIKRRTEMQDYGINIIIGAAQYKRKLSDAGIELYQKIFDGMGNSKKTIYILVDEYDKIRNLKLESWYTQINTGKGIWLGNGFSSQSIFSCNELTSEDKKYNYDGLAYTITDAKYNVIKTVMDGDD